LLNATLLLGVGAVTMTPDTPLLFFWTATLWAVARARSTERAGWWLAAGAFGGCALASKYTAALLGAGLVLWLAATREGRAWARRWQPWAGGALALAVFSPVLAWNAAHGWASFAKQGDRTGDWRPAHAIRFLGELIGSQVALATPLVFALCVWGTWRVTRTALSSAREDGAAGLLACLTLLPAAVFIEHALGDRVQGNWPAVVYPSACIAAAGLGSLWWRPAAALGLAVTAAAYMQAAVPPIALPRALDPTLIRLAGWPFLAREVAAEAERSGAAFVTAESYGLLAELAHDAPTALPVIAAGPRWALIRLRAAPASAPSGDTSDGTGLLVETARRREPPDPALWDVIALLSTLDRARGGVVAESYRLYRVRPRRGTVVFLLPRPEAP
jgi:4-amino-4-deoxy-L-arabinose transferase-like glycosyltransferase